MATLLNYRKIPIFPARKCYTFVSLFVNLTETSVAIHAPFFGIFLYVWKYYVPWLIIYITVARLPVTKMSILAFSILKSAVVSFFLVLFINPQLLIFRKTTYLLLPYISLFFFSFSLTMSSLSFCRLQWFREWGGVEIIMFLECFLRLRQKSSSATVIFNPILPICLPIRPTDQQLLVAVVTLTATRHPSNKLLSGRCVSDENGEYCRQRRIT